MRKLFLVCAVLLIPFSPPCHCQTLRISVLSRFRPTDLDLRPSPTEALIVEAAGERFVLEPDSYQATAQIRIAEGGLLVAISGRQVRTKFLRVAGRTGAADFVLSVPQKISRRYFGSLAITAKDGKIQTIVSMDLETAVASVVAAETEPGTPLEALKSQAVVTRSYFAAAKNRHEDFDFCDLAHCQVLGSLPNFDSPAARATVETRGLVLVYHDRSFAAMFTRSCAGRTRTPSQDGLPSNGYPYFAVRCGYCRGKPFRWTRKLAPSDFALLAKGENGRLAVCRGLGWNAVPSDDFTARHEGAQIVLEGKGQGHGIGFCQRGAEAMAASGADSAAILRHYFPNTKILRLKRSSYQFGPMR